MEEEDAYDYEFTVEDTPMDEEYFVGTDETLVDIPGTQDLYQLKDNSPTVEDNDNEDDGDCGSQFDSHPSGSNKSTAQWSEDTVQTETMSQIGICINTIARVVVCIACASVIKPLELPVHFRKTHPPMSITAAFCRELVACYNLLEDPLQSRPGSIITAVYGLDLFDDFLSCDACGYACKTESRIKRHIGRSVGCTSYRLRQVQTFRSSSNQMYFGVQSSHTSDPIEDPLDPVVYLKAKFAPLPFDQTPIACPTACDANHFLNIEHWHKHVEGRTGAEIDEVVRVRAAEIRQEVRIVAERYAESAIKQLEKLDDEVKGAIGDYHG
jgi:hypothetical protein